MEGGILEAVYDLFDVDENKPQDISVHSTGSHRLLF